MTSYTNFPVAELNFHQICNDTIEDLKVSLFEDFPNLERVLYYNAHMNAACERFKKETFICLNRADLDKHNIDNYVTDEDFNTTISKEQRRNLTEVFQNIQTALEIKFGENFYLDISRGHIQKQNYWLKQRFEF